jgi:hypothetical protein
MFEELDLKIDSAAVHPTTDVSPTLVCPTALCSKVVLMTKCLTG